MKICISSQGDNLDSQVDPRFGRCQFFIIVDTDSLEFETINNENIAASGGAGIKAGQLVSSKGIKALLTGNVGPNAFETLNASGVEVIVGVSGSVKEAVERFKKGEFKPVKSPSVDSHFGMRKNQ